MVGKWLPRSSSRASFKFSTLKYILPTSKEKQRLKEMDANPDTPDSELDSGISVNGNYDEPRQNNHPPEIYERIDEIQNSEGKTIGLSWRPWPFPGLPSFCLRSGRGSI